MMSDWVDMRGADSWALGQPGARRPPRGRQFAYDGLLFIRHELGRPERETGVPVGDEPSEVDDEVCRTS